MGRTEIQNERFVAAYGCTDLTGNFVEIWKQPVNEQTAPLLHIDNSGVTMTNQGRSNLPYAAKWLADEIRVLFQIAEEDGKESPKLDAMAITILLTRCLFEVYEMDIRIDLDQ